MEGTKQESLKRALGKEEDEKSFYLKAASGAKSLFAKRMFEELAREGRCPWERGSGNL